MRGGSGADERSVRECPPRPRSSLRDGHQRSRSRRYNRASANGVEIIRARARPSRRRTDLHELKELDNDLGSRAKEDLSARARSMNKIQMLRAIADALNSLHNKQRIPMIMQPVAHFFPLASALYMVFRLSANTEIRTMLKSKSTVEKGEKLLRIYMEGRQAPKCKCSLFGFHHCWRKHHGPCM